MTLTISERIEEAIDRLDAFSYHQLCRFMTWITEYELAIAEKTGRNPAQVRQLKRDFSDWRSKLQLIETLK